MLRLLLRALGRGLRHLGVGLLALLIAFEEWGWEPLQRALARLGRWPPLRALEALISRLPPHAALGLVMLPSLTLLPVKFLALWLLADGHALLGVAVVVLAKLVGTAVLSRLFLLTRPALLRLPWFARLYSRWLPFKDNLLVWVRATWVWRVGRVLKRALGRALRRAWAG